MAKRFSKYSGKKKDDYVLPAGPDGNDSGKGWFSRLGEKVSKTTSREIQMLNKGQEFSRMRSNVRSECKTERVK